EMVSRQSVGDSRECNRIVIPLFPQGRIDIRRTALEQPKPLAGRGVRVVFRIGARPPPRSAGGPCRTVRKTTDKKATDGGPAAFADGREWNPGFVVRAISA